jgi:hypothetical protein
LFTSGALFTLAAAVAAAEPGLLDAQEAAARVAAGSAGEDRSRAGRARGAHWAPQLRVQALVRDDDRLRTGEFRLAPVREQDVSGGRSWSVTLTWDFAQVVFAREETQLALAHAHLARLRREAADRAAVLWSERQQARWLWASLRTREACLALLRLTAQLDALTGGLFREAAEREEADCSGAGDSR